MWRSGLHRLYSLLSDSWLELMPLDFAHSSQVDFTAASASAMGKSRLRIWVFRFPFRFLLRYRFSFIFNVCVLTVLLKAKNPLYSTYLKVGDTM